MASSHHLMTVCMFCLLCAAHSSCSAHTGVMSSDQNSKTFQDLMKHEKFKNDRLADILSDGHTEQMPKRKESHQYMGVEVNKNNKNGDTLSYVGYNLIGFKTTYSMYKSLVRSKHANRLKHKSADIESNISLNDNNQSSELHVQHNIVRDDADVPNQFGVGQEMNYIEKQSDQRLNSVESMRSKRDTTQAGTEKSSGAPTDYRITLKNIDVDFYVRELFMQFGNKDTMTMDLEGFDRMLKQLDLDRMVVEVGKIENGTSVQKPPVEKVINGVRYNSTNVTCINSIDLVSSLNTQYNQNSISDVKHQDEGRNQSQINNSTDNHSLSGLKSNIFINAQVLSKICPILLYQKVSNTSYERQGCVEERKYPKVTLNNEDHHHHHIEHTQGNSNNRTAVWIYSSLCILFISLCGLLGIVVIPIMEHVYYQQILQFLVALGVGTLSGDALLHLLPHALSPDTHDHDGEDHSHNHTDSMYKGLVAMIGVVFFYFTEKILNLISEWRQKKMKKNKENKLPPRVRVMRNDIGCLKGSGSCSSHTGRDGFLKFPTLTMFKPQSGNKNGEQNNVQSSGKICKHKYSEYPYCYDEITTDTMDEHHLRDMSKNSKNDTAANKNIMDKERPLSVVSLNVMNDHNEQFTAEPGVNDALLTNDGKVNNVTIVTNNSAHKNDVSNHRRAGGLKIMDGHKRSRSADRAGELEDYTHKKRDEESYTVILREHSQNHHGHSHSHGHVHSPPSSLSSVVWMVIMGDGLHNFTDGMAIGAAFSSNIAGGFSTAIAVLCHELPHEIGDFAVLLKAGMSAKRAVFYNMLSSILCLFGMMVGVCIGHTPEASAWIFAAAAGMFLYIALVDMIPELSSSHSNEGALCQCMLQLCGLTCGIGIMFVIAMYEDHLKSLFG